MKFTRKHYTILTVLNLIAVPITIFLVYAHFKPEASTVCQISESWDCDIVNKSIYSEVLGIPVSIMGLAFYLLMLAYSIRGFFRDQSHLAPYALLATLAGTLFALYLTAVETFILYTYCIFCVTQQVIILIELGTLFHLWRRTKSQAHQSHNHQ